MKKTMLVVVAVLALLCGAPKQAAAVDGTPSTGSYTVVYSTNLAAASATGTLTVIDTAALSGTYISIGAYQFKAGRDYAVGATTVATAANIAGAINAFQPYGSYPYWVTASTSSESPAVTLTAQASGSAYNAIGLVTSNSAEITVSAATMTGGLNNASITINGTTLIQGRDWLALDVSSNTAISLSAAINHAPGLKNLVSGYWTGSGGAVYLRSLFAPNAYSMTAIDNSTTNANLTPSQAAMTGGTAGFLSKNDCYLGSVDALPTSNYPAGCIAYLASAPGNLYMSTEAVAGTQSYQILTSSVSATPTFNTLTVTGAASVGGGLGLYSRTLSQLQAITPSAAGLKYYCSNCAAGYQDVTSTGTAKDAFANPAGATLQ